MANQTKKIRELESFIDDRVDPEDYLLVATNSNAREITKKAHIREVIESYDNHKAEIASAANAPINDSDIATRPGPNVVTNGVEQKVDASGLNAVNLKNYIIAGADSSGLQAGLQVVDVCYNSSLESVSCFLPDGTTNPDAVFKTKKLAVLGIEDVVDYEHITFQDVSDDGTVSNGRLTLPLKRVQYAGGVVSSIDHYPASIFQSARYTGSGESVTFDLSNNRNNSFSNFSFATTVTDLENSSCWVFCSELGDWQFIGGIAPTSSSRPYINWWTWSDKMSAWFWTDSKALPMIYVDSTFEGTNTTVGWCFLGNDTDSYGKVYTYSNSEWVDLENTTKLDSVTYAITAPPDLPRIITDINVGSVDIQLIPR
jgi:hypothetical protein